MQTPDESPLFPKGAEELSLRGANDENIGRSSDLAWLRANQWAYSRLHSISPQREVFGAFYCKRQACLDLGLIITMSAIGTVG